jgi:hypothetical protein
MGFIGVIVLLIIGIICYNVWFNLKYSEGEQIMMQHKREKKEIKMNQNESMRKLANELFSLNQKLAIIVVLNRILCISKKDFHNGGIAQKKYLSNLATEVFKLNNEQILNYNNTVKNNDQILKNDLKIFDATNNFLLISYASQMLESGGALTNGESNRAREILKKSLNLSDIDFDYAACSLYGQHNFILN